MIKIEVTLLPGAPGDKWAAVSIKHSDALEGGEDLFKCRREEIKSKLMDEIKQAFANQQKPQVISFRYCRPAVDATGSLENKLFSSFTQSFKTFSDFVNFLENSETQKKLFKVCCDM